jgi:hypothetical protein
MVDTIAKQSEPGRGVGLVDRITPAARPLDQFCVENVADGVVLYDTQRIQYHSLNTYAYAVWILCDGKRSVRALEAELSKSLSDVQSEAVVLAIEELGEAGLLQEAEGQFDARIQRRAVLKLAAAGVVGALGLPVVSSITAPDSASAQTGSCPECPNGQPGCNNNQSCTAACECKSGCCCVGPGGQDCVANLNQCAGANEFCLAPA